MDLQDVFNEIVMEGKTLSFQLESVAVFHARRVSLLRKFKNYQELNESVGLPVDTDAYIRCIWDPKTLIASFSMQVKTKRSFGDPLPQPESL